MKLQFFNCLETRQMGNVKRKCASENLTKGRLRTQPFFPYHLNHTIELRCFNIVPEGV